MGPPACPGGTLIPFSLNAEGDFDADQSQERAIPGGRVIPGRAQREPGMTMWLSLPRRHSERVLEALRINRPDLRIDDARRALAVDRIQNLLGGDAAHVLARLDRDASRVRACQHVVEL